MFPLALAATALLAAGCGSSDKPDYCSNVSDLQQSVDLLKDVPPEAGALSNLKTDLQAVQTDANAVVSSAKQDFPNETSALKSSVASLSSAIEQFASSPTAKNLAAVTPEIDSTVTAAKNLSSATKSACD
jgi:hypothetical protein